MRSKGRVGRAQAKPKNDGEKSRGRPPTYTTSSGKKVAKVKLTPTTSTLASFLDIENKMARRSGEIRDKDYVNNKFHEVLNQTNEEKEKQEEILKRKAVISNKRRQAAACRRDRMKAVPEDECGDYVATDIEEEVVAVENKVKEVRELGRAQFYHKRKQLFNMSPRTQEQRLKLLTLLKDAPVFQSLLVWSKTEASSKTKYHNYRDKNPKVVRSFLESKINFNDSRKLLRELAVECCNNDVESFYNFGLQFKDKQDTPPKLLAKQIVSRERANIFKTETTTAAKTITIKLGCVAYKELVLEFGDVTVQDLMEALVCSWPFAKKIIDACKSGKEDTLYIRQMNQHLPDLKQFETFLKREENSRVVPGATVSVAYGKRAEEYLLLGSKKKLVQKYKLEFPDETFGIRWYLRKWPKNFKTPTITDTQYSG